MQENSLPAANPQDGQITLKPLRAKTEYINNTKLANYLILNDSIINQGQRSVRVLKTKGKPSKDITTEFTLTDEGVSLSKPLTPYDKAVMDSIFTIMKSGYDTFTPAWVVRVMTGNMHMAVTEKKKQECLESIERLRRTFITIDCTKEMSLRDGRRGDAVQKVKYSSYLLPVSWAEITYNNGKTDRAYKLLECPALYKYAEQIKQVLSLPIGVVEQCSKVSQSPESVLIARYVITRVECMKHPGNGIVSNRISMQWTDKDTGEAKGLLGYLGLDEESIPAKTWETKKARIKAILADCLRALQEMGMIEGFKEYRICHDGTILHEGDPAYGVRPAKTGGFTIQLPAA